MSFFLFNWAEDYLAKLVENEVLNPPFNYRIFPLNFVLFPLSILILELREAMK